MRFMVIVKADERSEAGEMPSEQLLTDMMKFNEELVKSGMMLAGEGLHPSSSGKRIRFKGKDHKVIDGPFPAARELVAGFWLLEASSMDEVVNVMKRCPMDDDAELEIRAIFGIEDFGDAATPELREQEASLRAKTKQTARH